MNAAQVREAEKVCYGYIYLLWRCCPDPVRQERYEKTLNNARRHFLARGLTEADLRDVEHICECNVERVK